MSSQRATNNPLAHIMHR